MKAWAEDLANLRAAREVLEATDASRDYGAYEDANLDVIVAERAFHGGEQGALHRAIAKLASEPTGLFSEPFYGTEMPTPGVG